MRDESGMRQRVAVVMGRKVTRGTLLKAFARVENRENWKSRIDTVVDVASDRERETIGVAIVFFTGSVPTWTVVPGGTLPGCRYRVQAAGYYAAVGA